MNSDSHNNFRARLQAKELLVGTYSKTPSSIICEVLALTDLDAVCLDAEHAPFDRLNMDGCVHVLRSAAMPSLIRTCSAAPEQILNALDCGATGVIVPHVVSAEQARAIVASAQFGAGGRGYAGSTRAAAYTTKKMAQHQADSAKQTTVIVQIEDIEAIDAIDEIAAVDGIDCLFVGRIDLTVAYNAQSPNDEIVIEAVNKVCAAGRKHNKAVGMFVPSVQELPQWQAQGASLFLMGSDHSFILSGAKELVSQAKK